MNPRKKELEAIQLKAANMQIKKQIEKGKGLFSDIGGKLC